MVRLPPISNRTASLFPYTTLVRSRGRLARRQSVMAPVFRESEVVFVGDPGQLCGKLFAFAVGGVDRHRKAGLARCGDHAFQSSEMIEICNDALVHPRASLAQETDVAGRHIDCRTGRSERHTSELQSLMRISYAVFCLTKNTT